MNREESWPVRLAKESLRFYMAHSKIMPEASGPLPPEAAKRAGVFVSLCQSIPP